MEVSSLDGIDLTAPREEDVVDLLLALIIPMNMQRLMTLVQ